MQSKKNSGYTVPTAILMMLLLFSFAMGLLMFAAYNYNNASKRYEKMQTYLYAKNMMDECEYSIMQGELNEYLSVIVDDVNRKLRLQDSSSKNLYGKEYSFKVELEESEMLINPFNNDKIDIDLYVTYKPVKSNVKLPGEPYDYVSVGDWMDLEIRIKKIRGNDEGEMEYQYLSEFYCTYDNTRESDGTIKSGLAPAELISYRKMRWTPFQHTGKIYTE